MAITPESLRTHERLTINTNRLVDHTTRTLTARWATAWRELSTEWEAAISQIIAAQTAGETLHAGRIAQLDRVTRALTATAEQLAALTEGIPDAIDGPLNEILADTTAATRQIVAAQLPATLRPGFALVSKPAMNAIIRRTMNQVHAASWPLTDDAISAMKSTLIRAVPSGWAPARAAREMLERTQTEFNGGLARAMTIARTEMLDAHRSAANQLYRSNKDVIQSWVWTAHLDARTCPACIAMHGTEHSVETPGPEGHQNCRCTGIPKTKTWAELGLPDLDEPADALPDASQWIDDNPTAAQRALGRTRYDMLASGDITLNDLATKRSSAHWRDSYHATPVRDLERKPRT